MSSQAEKRVCIIGAGPVGLTLALRLSDFGVGSVVFDENPGLKKEGSKACLIQGDALEILDKSNCGDRIYREGVPWTHSNVYIRGTNITRTEYGLNNRFGPFVNISQYRIEQILLEEILRRSNISIEWSSRIVKVDQSDEKVIVEIDTGAGSEIRAFPYAVACNGARSNVRDLVGVKWNGYRHTARFLITDIKAKLPFAKERHFHFDPPFNRGYQVIMHPQPDDVWRIDWQLPPEIDIEVDKANGSLERRIRSVIGDVEYRLEWLSVYRFQQRTAERFIKGRVMFAGDAAHALPPYGSRGMNSGIQDADNLAWKLALVTQGCAAPALLDTYHCERAAAAEENIAVTERTIRFMVPSNPLVRLRRKLFFVLARRFRPFRKYVNSGTMAKPHRYIASPLVQAPVLSPVVGMFAADANIHVAGKTLKLRELLGRGFTFVYVGEQAPRVLPALQGSQVPLGSFELSAIVLSSGHGRSHSTPAMRNIHVARANESVLRNYEKDKWHLIRPDMHVAGVYDFHSQDEFDAALWGSSLLAGPGVTQRLVV
ncbi:MAG: FAD-dependent oxidoreductase [Alcaligenaceae bacterium]|nr:MAG: FAD-dependent oxidoreductase [Alcaligenaceae bacterium]